MSRTFEYRLQITCAKDGTADQARVEQLLDLAFQDLVYDDEFIVALDETEAVTIQVTPILGK